MVSLGIHFIVEFSFCDPKRIDDIQFVEKAMIKAANDANATIIQVTFNQFEPYGVSGVVVLAESHISVHTWPEYGYAAVDIYTCGLTASPEKALESLKKSFKSKKVFYTKLSRGMSEKNLFKHTKSD